MVFFTVMIFLMNLYQSAPTVLMIRPSSPVHTEVRWCVGMLFISVMAFIKTVMMAVMKILLPVATAISVQTMNLCHMPCAGTAAPVLQQTFVVMVLGLTALMVLMNLTHIPIVTIAQRRAISPAQVFLGIVESSVTARQHAQINGMKYSPSASLT